MIDEVDLVISLTAVFVGYLDLAIVFYVKIQVDAACSLAIGIDEEEYPVVLLPVFPADFQASHRRS